MAAGSYDFQIEQGATFQRVLTWTDADDNPFNLTGYSGRMMIRPTYADIDTGPPILSLTSPSSGIALGGGAGTIVIFVPAANTAALPIPPTADHKYRYDLEVQAADGTVYRVLQGEVAISQEVTR